VIGALRELAWPGRPRGVAAGHGLAGSGRIGALAICGEREKPGLRLVEQAGVIKDLPVAHLNLIVCLSGLEISAVGSRQLRCRLP
jgi:hypothetical protein